MTIAAYKFRIGTILSAFPGCRIRDLAERASAYGLDAAEIGLEPPGRHPYDITEKEIKATARAGRMLGIRYSVHAPMLGLNIASSNRGIREESVRQIERSVEICAALGGRVVTVHNGQPDWGGDWARPACEKEGVASFARIIRFARRRGVTLCIENLGGGEYLFPAVADMVRLFKRLSDLNPLLTLDTGHAHISGELDEYLKRFKSKIGHIHLHDNDGKNDQHQLPGEGRIDFGRTVWPYLRSYRGTVILEWKNPDKDGLGKLRKSVEFLRRL